jgi:hypothetical protein
MSCRDKMHTHTQNYGLRAMLDELKSENIPALTPFIYPSTGAATRSKESVDVHIEHQITHACHETACADRKTWIERWI